MAGFRDFSGEPTTGSCRFRAAADQWGDLGCHHPAAVASWCHQQPPVAALRVEDVLAARRKEFRAQSDAQDARRREVAAQAAADAAEREAALRASGEADAVAEVVGARIRRETLENMNQLRHVQTLRMRPHLRLPLPGSRITLEDVHHEIDTIDASLINMRASCVECDKDRIVGSSQMALKGHCSCFDGASRVTSSCEGCAAAPSGVCRLCSWQDVRRAVADMSVALPPKPPSVPDYAHDLLYPYPPHGVGFGADSCGCSQCGGGCACAPSCSARTGSARSLAQRTLPHLTTQASSLW